jgi:hypothetical protein
MAFNLGEFFDLQSHQGLRKPRLPGQPPLENNAAVDALGNSLLTQNDKNDINMVSGLFGGSEPEATPQAASPTGGEMAETPTGTGNPEDSALVTAALGPLGMLLG